MRLRQKLLAAVLAIALSLASFNTCAFATMGASITQSQLLGLLVSAYEFIAGEEIDESAITSKLSTDKDVRKALELELLSDYEVAWVHLPATRQNAVARVLALKNALRTRLYGSATRQATVAQTRDELGLALKLAGYADRVDYAVEITAGPDDDAPLTRALLSELLVRAYEALYGEVKLSDETAPDDTDSEYVLKAIKLGLMAKYEARNEFEPDAPVQLRQLAAPIQSLINHDDASLREWTKGEARAAVSELMLSCVGVERAEGEARSKLLDVSWDWYVNQLTTGKYSLNNCMPACGEMVLNYLDRENKTTTQMLRALSPHDGEGWYDVELEDVLKGEGVKLDSVYDMTTANMLRDLDNDRLLIVMCNFDGAKSGHAMVVCGYEITPAGTWFICNDPESSTTNKYGKPSGYMRRVESQELIMAMQRHVARYFRVMN